MGRKKQKFKTTKSASTPTTGRSGPKTSLQKDVPVRISKNQESVIKPHITNISEQNAEDRRSDSGDEGDRDHSSQADGKIPASVPVQIKVISDPGSPTVQGPPIHTTIRNFSGIDSHTSLKLFLIL